MHSEVLSAIVFIIVHYFVLSIWILLFTKCKLPHSANEFIRTTTNFLFSKLYITKIYKHKPQEWWQSTNVKKIIINSSSQHNKCMLGTQTLYISASSLLVWTTIREILFYSIKNILFLNIWDSRCFVNWKVCNVFKPVNGLYWEAWTCDTWAFVDQTMIASFHNVIPLSHNFLLIA